MFARKIGAILLMAALFVLAPLWAEASGRRFSDSPREVIIQVFTHSGVSPELLDRVAVPDFTLYGDGRVIFSRLDASKNKILLEARLDEGGINLLLDHIQSQGFWDLNENYMNLTVKDLDTTVIAVNTKEKSKQVRIYGLLLAARQKMLPQGLFALHARLSAYQAEGEKEYVPEKISLLVSEYSGAVPKEAKVQKWKVAGIDLEKCVDKEKTFIVKYRETVLEGKQREDVIKRIGRETLFSNQAGFYQTYYVSRKKIFKVAYRPHLPYEQGGTQ
jgi:hypothetical protein